MNLIVEFTEVISNNYQGAIGVTHERTALFEVDPATSVGDLFELVAKNLMENNKTFFCHEDNRLLRINKIQIVNSFKGLK